MIQTVEAVIDGEGRVRLLAPVRGLSVTDRSRPDQFRRRDGFGAVGRAVESS